jgi:hypothetical protein
MPYRPIMGTAKPVVLVDVDGVLNPIERGPGYRRHRATPDGITYRLWLNAAHGPMLRTLAADTGAELHWASFWRDSANDWIAPKVGLPQLPHVPIPPLPIESGMTLGGWKARHVAEWAGRRPFVWFEDEPDAPAALLTEPGLGDHLLVPVDPVVGLTDEHIEQARGWLLALRTD